MTTDDQRVRIVFLLRLRPDSAERFRAAYEAVRWNVARTDGHLGDQLCQSVGDPDQWMITSEWESLEHFLAWERTDAHRELAAPMMACVVERSSLRFVVRAATSGAASGARS
ncbi:antibiotic biosynthesis monooxygenase family protein [Micromonospora sp. NPDC049101]|uniref:antibiotic biosynthesis monooxygenase family protein n=1 Tax=unclassified Micromonospora TaxID=2617518 RepID=UPI0033DB6252